MVTNPEYKNVEQTTHRETVFLIHFDKRFKSEIWSSELIFF